ncbi:glutamine-hydrolyzing carbamoyl-phosphate synthase small subunit [Avrilella dinanensis]|uniref:Carbamoyl phosphate synthase small chain n=1 Tax=Avrilella dinanensis TaxID=2008672 RepID=A0A2M9R794_9FLAO|nr:glutamine-hydrolyzing carbamoyl-phosphate synthase small subunit [Avrilella dinanensis]PJR04736.1 carbamoyl phosphate synthase small subunit [Avrilella dinanensis]
MKYQHRKRAIILLEDGTIFYGKSVGIEGTTFGEICFNTGVTGYQEIFTDPSYYKQIMVSTTAHVGNYGVTDVDTDSSDIQIAGLVCRNFSYTYSRPAATDSLYNYFEKKGLVAVSDVDTRALTAHIRDNGAMNAVISTDGKSVEELKALLTEVPSMEGMELASKVSTKEPYFFGEENATYKVAAMDFGIKTNILRCLAERDCYVKVFPYNSTKEQLDSFNPDGYFLSNGPGDPQPLTEVVKEVTKIIQSSKPVFGICLGHQLIALSHGVNTYKMFNGHRGINHPVMNINTGKGEITSQNHGFAVVREEVENHADLEISHYHINDNTVAGIRLKNKPVFSVQYHPEASPGPHDSRYLFDDFVENMKAQKQG